MKLIIGLIAFLFMLLGYIINKEKASNIIAGYDENKDNLDFTCKLIGFNFILIGGVLFSLTFISLIFNNSFINKFYAISCVGVIILIFFVIYLRKSINRVK